MAGYLKFSVENVENEFPHNLVGIVEHFLHDGRVSFTQRDNIGKNVSTRKGALIIKKIQNNQFSRISLVLSCSGYYIENLF